MPKTVRTPIRWRNFMKGTLSGYTRLGNEPGPDHLPLLTGVLYLERSQLTYGDYPRIAGQIPLAD